MPDIQMRFHHDMLTLSSPLESTLIAQGFDLSFGVSLLSVLEPEAVSAALRLQVAAGAPCLVAPTAGVTRARLAHQRAADRDINIAQAAKSLATAFTTQHVLAEIGATGLPIDPNSKSSLTANRDEYLRAARAIGDADIDAFFVNGLTGAADARCALMGVRQVFATPLIASVDVNEEGIANDGTGLEDIVAVMADLEADVVGFCTSADSEGAARLAQRAAHACDRPLLVQLNVQKQPSSTLFSHARGQLDIPYAYPSSMVQAADCLRAAGAQFIRAVGAATPAYAGALAAALAGTEPIR